MSDLPTILRRLLILAGGVLVVGSVVAAITASLDREPPDLRSHLTEGQRGEAEQFEAALAQLQATTREQLAAGRIEAAAHTLNGAEQPDPELTIEVGGALLEAAERRRREWDPEEARRLLELAKRVFQEEREPGVVEAELLIAKAEQLSAESDRLLAIAENALEEGAFPAAEEALIALESGEFSPTARAKATELSKVLVSEREARDHEAVQVKLTSLLDTGQISSARELLERHSRVTGSTEYRNRISALRELEEAGGTEGYLPVRNALRFLVKCQGTDGGFTAESYRAAFPKDKAVGRGKGAYDLGISGLCLMAFTAFRDLDIAGEFEKPAANCASFLVKSVSRGGTVKGHHYNHAIVALALLERVLALGKESTRTEYQAAERIIVYLTRMAQLPDGGWRYTAQGTSDSSITCWVLQALDAARRAGIELHETVLSQGVRYLAGLTTEEGWTGYVLPQRSETMTAAALLVWQLFPEHATEGAADRARDALLGYLKAPLDLSRKPDTAGTAVTKLKQLWLNHYGWYYTTYAFHRLGGDAWAAWGPLLANTLRVDQLTLGDLAGSWDPDRRFGGRGGRLYTTALNALSLEVYYR